MRWPAVLLLGIFSYLFFLLYNLPAQQAIGWIGNEATQGVVLEGVSGSVWSGKARKATYQRSPLGSLGWRFLPSRLLLGKLAFDIELKDGGQQLQGKLLLGGDVSMQGVDALVLANRLPEWLQQRQLQIGGKIRLQQLDFTLSEGRLTAAEGTVQWLDGDLQRPISLALGDDLQAELSTDDDSGEIKAQIHDLKGRIGLAGEVRLKADGNFQFDGRLKPTDKTDPGLSSALQAIGRRQSDGSFQLNYAGKI